jgi:hypothetical protein
MVEELSSGDSERDVSRLVLGSAMLIKAGSSPNIDSVIGNVDMCGGTAGK